MPGWHLISFSKETLMIGHPGQNQHATQVAWLLDGFIFNRLRA
jgi:hypothetical protein